jgi:4-methylaminobutanoate oxidase (formaldehyde-forming)
MDLWDVDIRRVAPFQTNPRYLHDRTVEMVGRLYAMHWPFQQPTTARDVRKSVLHDRLAARGACFGAVMGWERANWYATPGMEPAYRYSWGRQNWFECSAEEHRAVREAVGLFDQSSFTKLRLEGPDAVVVLERLCANEVDVPVGRIVYTQMLNPRGGIECDLTVTRVATDAYLIVTGASVATHDTDWIRRHLGDARVVLTDVTSGAAVLGVMGPRSRALLARLTDADLSNSAFPFLASREIWLGSASVRASRVTYVGELGWEIYVPTDLAPGVYDALVSAGEDLGLRHAGYHAMDSLRIEKAYRSWGHDLGSEDTPLEAGLAFAVRLDKKAPFLGRDALLAQREKPLGRRLVVFTLDDSHPLLYHDEPILRDGVLIGRICSGAYGHTIGRSIGLGYVECPDGVTDAFIENGRWEIEIACERQPARAQLAPPYDPKSLRVRG